MAYQGTAGYGGYPDGVMQNRGQRKGHMRIGQRAQRIYTQNPRVPQLGFCTGKYYGETLVRQQDQTAEENRLRTQASSRMDEDGARFPHLE